MAARAPLPRLDGELVTAVLGRIGFDERPPITADSLRRLHRAHLERVPFENLDIHLGVPIPLDACASAQKVALRRRGGFCYELNGAFAALLSALGFAVELREARVYSAEGASGRQWGHLCLVVHLGDDRFLADVGFGRCFDEPIALTPHVPAHDTAGVFVLRPGEDGALDLLLGDAAQYRIEPGARRLGEFAPGCEFHQSSPESSFTSGTVCTIRTREGRATLSGMLLIETTASGREERALDRADLASVLADRFGIVLDDEELDRLARVPGRPVAAG